jgi:PAS domain S-box-containing protein
MLVEQALRESERYARNLIESSLNMIIAVDKDRRIVEFNKAAEEAFGYPREEVVGENVSILYADRQEASTIGQTMLEKTQSIREVYNKRKNGDVFPCLLSASTLRDTHGNVIGYMGISRDITQLKQAQTELLMAHNELKEKNTQLQELNASKDKFFSIISHDLRGSFGTLLGFAQLITENIDDYSKERVKGFVIRLRTSAERLYALLENLLTWSRIQRGVMKCLPRSPLPLPGVGPWRRRPR